jgi:hypothetical protein
MKITFNRCLDIPGITLDAQEIITNRRRQILNDLHEYYKNSGKHIAVRLGNLVLLLSPIKVRLVELFVFSFVNFSYHFRS